MLNYNVSNIVNSLVGKQNIIYYIGKKNLFFYTLVNCDSLSIIDHANQPFSLIASDNPIDYSQSIEKISLHYHSNSVIFFHDNPPSALKKEDKVILNRKLQNSFKIFFNQSIKQSWGLPDFASLVMDYGIPTLSEKNDKKNACVINLDNNPGIDRLYQHIKNYIHECDVIDNSNLLNRIPEYKICICPNSIYDSIFSASCGAWVLSSIPKLEENICNITYINDYGVIQDRIKDILLNWDSLSTLIKSSQQHIKEKYPIDIFYNNISTLFNQISKRAFIYET